METAVPAIAFSYESPTPNEFRRALPIYLVESLNSLAGTLLSVGAAFYMTDHFGWGMRQNFMLAAGQGLVYVPAALLAGKISRKLGSKTAICIANAVLLTLSVIACLLSQRATVAVGVGVAATLLAYTFSIGTTWPVLEGMIATGSATGLAKRLAIYNVVWPAAGAVAIAVEGVAIRYLHGGIFLIPAAMHLVVLLVMLTRKAEPTDAEHQSHKPPVHPDLLRNRKLALWLSRTALPATYTVIYGVMPLMPFLAVMHPLKTTQQTAVASVWLFTRWAAFVGLALGTWWQTKPQLLIWAAVLMLVSYFGMTLPLTRGHYPIADLIAMITWQAALGAALGVVYSASLYFGMALSEGSTEHGGYHEALIGVGWVLGPAAGALAQTLHPGEVWAGIAAVGAVITLSVIVVMAVAIILGRRADA